VALGRPATGLPRFYMDVDWHRGPKWAGAGADALLVHSIAVGYCTKHNTDGRLPGDPEDLSLALGIKLSVVRKALKELVDGRRWDHDGQALVIVGYAGHNPLAAEVAEHTERQRTRGSLGNHKRWHVDRGIVDETCPYCSSPGDDRQATSPEGDPQGTPSPGESLGMGWDGMGTDELKPADNSRPPATTEAAAGQDQAPEALGDQARTTRLEAAVDLLVTRELDRNPSRTNRGAHANAVRAGKLTDHRQRGMTLIADDPSITPRTLADLLEPPPQPRIPSRTEPPRRTPDGQPFIPGIGVAPGAPQLPNEPDPETHQQLLARARHAAEHPRSA
jgi:hypothetical protein